MCAVFFKMKDEKKEMFFCPLGLYPKNNLANTSYLCQSCYNRGRQISTGPPFDCGILLGLFPSCRPGNVPAYLLCGRLRTKRTCPLSSLNTKKYSFRGLEMCSDTRRTLAPLQREHKRAADRKAHRQSWRTRKATLLFRSGCWMKQLHRAQPHIQIQRSGRRRLQGSCNVPREQLQRDRAAEEEPDGHL